MKPKNSTPLPEYLLFSRFLQIHTQEPGLCAPEAPFVVGRGDYHVCARRLLFLPLSFPIPVLSDCVGTFKVTMRDLVIPGPNDFSVSE